MWFIDEFLGQEKVVNLPCFVDVNLDQGPDVGQLEALVFGTLFNHDGFDLKEDFWVDALLSAQLSLFGGQLVVGGQADNV